MKKVRKYRGSKTHGGGSMKKRRGAGSRGGRGRAGTGKRGDQKKPSYWKTYRPGMHGFTPQTRKNVRAINVSQLEKDIQVFVDSGHAKKSSKGFSVDLTAAGYDKLLGSGKVSTKLAINVSSASPGAVSKVEEAGGSVKLPSEE